MTTQRVDRNKPASIGRINQVRATIKETVPQQFLTDDAREERQAAQAVILEKMDQIKAIQNQQQANYMRDWLKTRTGVDLTADDFDKLDTVAAFHIHLESKERDEFNSLGNEDPAVVSLREEVQQLRETMPGFIWPQATLLVRAAKAKNEGDLEDILTEANRYAEGDRARRRNQPGA